MFGLFRKKPKGMTRERAEAIINAYGAVMMREASTVSDERDLPFTKAEIKEAILFGIAATADPKMIDMLKAGYVTLADYLLLNDDDRIVLRQQREWASRVVNPASLTRDEAKAWIEHQQSWKRLLSRVEANAYIATHEIDQFMAGIRHGCPI